MTITVQTHVGSITFQSSQYEWEEFKRNPTENRLVRWVSKRTDMTRAQVKTFIKDGYRVSASYS